MRMFEALESRTLLSFSGPLVSRGGAVREEPCNGVGAHHGGSHFVNGRLTGRN